MRKNNLENEKKARYILSLNCSDDTHFTFINSGETLQELQNHLQQLYDGLKLNNISKCCESMKIINSNIEFCISSSFFDNHFLEFLTTSLNFTDKIELLNMVLFCIGKLIADDEFRKYFINRGIFQQSLELLQYDSVSISFGALKIISLLLKDILFFNIPFNFQDQLFYELENNAHKSHDHEYLVVCILHTLVEYSSSSNFFSLEENYEKIIDIIMYIPNENTREDSLTETAETVLSFMNINFNFFHLIHYRYGITSVLFELLDENTITTDGISFPIPILKIILMTFQNLEPSKSCQIAKMISFPKYDSLISRSLIEVAELALKAISFLLDNDDNDAKNYYIDNCQNNTLILNIVMNRFIDEAPFILKCSGLYFLHSISLRINTSETLNRLLSFNLIEKCSFFIDSDDTSISTLYFKLICNLIQSSTCFASNSIVQHIIESNILTLSKDLIDNECAEENNEILLNCFHNIEQFVMDSS